MRCEKYLTQNRVEFSSNPKHQCCEACCTEGIPLAKIRGGLQDPLSIETLALMAEECGEVVQRIGKILRWGWEADFEGTTQQHKLETELGDILAGIALLAYNNQITYRGVERAYSAKINKLVEDNEGPKQRLLHAETPNATVPIAMLLREHYNHAKDAGGQRYVEMLVKEAIGEH